MSYCKVASCKNETSKKGMCKAHYLRNYRYGDPLAGGPLRVRNSGQCSVDGCDKTSTSVGMCATHRARILKFGQTEPVKTPPGTVHDYFSEVVVPFIGNECLKWPFATVNGYGNMQHDGRRQIVSRVACERRHGQPPTPKHEAAHRCGNGHEGCVNPEHLYWATRSENQMDRAAHGTSNEGERHGMSKLTESDVFSIRGLLAKGDTQTSISAIFNVTQSAISRIGSGDLWGHLL